MNDDAAEPCGYSAINDHTGELVRCGKAQHGEGWHTVNADGTGYLFGAWQ